MDFSLTVEPRTETGSKVKHVRAQGYIPGVVYGRQGQDAQALQFEETELMHLLRDGGGSQLIELQGLGEGSTHVLMREVQRDPARRNILHVDFYEVQMDVVVHTEVPIRYEGESPAIKAGAILIHNLERIEIECLPGDIPEAFVIDLELFQTEYDVVRSSDLGVPEGATIINATPTDFVASVTVPRILAEEEEEEEDVFAAEEGASEPDVISRGREEEA
jgi:large subunit ribosomal protein L25